MIFSGNPGTTLTFRLPLVIEITRDCFLKIWRGTNPNPTSTFYAGFIGVIIFYIRWPKQFPFN